MSNAKKLHLVPVLKTEQADYKATGLPDLPNRHGDVLESVSFGPRREMTLMITPLRWLGTRGYHGPAISVRFGGIVNFDEVQSLFRPRYCKESELNQIEYDEKHISKSGGLHLLLSFERIDVVVPIHCQSLTETEVTKA
ncbi:MAG: hypothetical protein ACRYFS_03170 [Janthinobacterium lividum]